MNHCRVVFSYTCGVLLSAAAGCAGGGGSGKSPSGPNPTPPPGAKTGLNPTDVPKPEAPASVSAKLTGMSSDDLAVTWFKYVLTCASDTSTGTRTGATQEVVVTFNTATITNKSSCTLAVTGTPTSAQAGDAKPGTGGAYYVSKQSATVDGGTVTFIMIKNYTGTLTNAAPASPLNPLTSDPSAVGVTVKTASCAAYDTKTFTCSDRPVAGN